ncbi:hypothetical protein LV35_04199 [Acinetobacter baumannii]|uniref:Uncharacterized protein n=1 Tax=Acinetobacter baumannii TaxID=470 RepID=A0AAJ0VM31_ACIBA|nr:hypothetical protein LV35_04199 [Acinetobacter baumannii]
MPHNGVVLLFPAVAGGGHRLGECGPLAEPAPEVHHLVCGGLREPFRLEPVADHRP